MMCNEVQTVGALGAVNRGFISTIAPAFDEPLSNSIFPVTEVPGVKPNSSPSAARTAGAVCTITVFFGLTIMEEGSELLDRLTRYLKGDKDVCLPILTSCCPAWVNLYNDQIFPGNVHLFCPIVFSDSTEHLLG